MGVVVVVVVAFRTPAGMEPLLLAMAIDMCLLPGGRDIVLMPPYRLRFQKDQGLMTNISLMFPIDGVARERNEIFTITFAGVEQGDLAYGATIIPLLTGIIQDTDISIDGEAI
jgi:hypothetical protein